MKCLIFIVVFTVNFKNFILANRVGDEKPTIYTPVNNLPTANSLVSEVSKDLKVNTQHDITNASSVEEGLDETESEETTEDETLNDQDESDNANQNHNSGESEEQQFELELELSAEEKLEETENKKTLEDITANNEGKSVSTSTKLGNSSQSDDSEESESGESEESEDYGEFEKSGESGNQQRENEENNDAASYAKKGIENEDAVVKFIVTSVEENSNVRFTKIVY